MSGRITAILAVLAVAVGAYIFFVDRPAVQRAAQAEKILGVQADDVQEISLAGEKGTIVARRDGKRWIITQPVKTAAAGFEVDRIVESLADLKAERRFDPGDKLSAYGLDKPVITVTLKLKSGASKTFFLGGEVPASVDRYARIGDQKDLIIVGSLTKSTLEKTLADLRRKELADFFTSEVQRVTFAAFGATFTLERDGDLWNQVVPVRLPASEEKVSELISDLSTAKPKQWIDRPQDLAKFGLDRPQVTLDVKLKDGRQVRVLLAQPEGAKVAYGQVAGEETVGELEPKMLEKYRLTPTAFLPQKPFRFKFSDVTRLTLERAGKKAEASRSPQGWTATGIPADQVSSLISDLEFLRAKETQVTPPPAGTPAFTIEVKAKSTIKIAFYKDGKDWRAVDPATGVSYRIEASELERFGDGVKAFLDIKKPEPPKTEQKKPVAPKTETKPDATRQPDTAKPGAPKKP